MRNNVLTWQSIDSQQLPACPGYGDRWGGEPCCIYLCVCVCFTRGRERNLISMVPSFPPTHSPLKAFYLNSSLRASSSTGPEHPPTHANISVCLSCPSTGVLLSGVGGRRGGVSLSWLLAGSSGVCSGRDTDSCWIPSSRSCLQPRMKSQFHGRK